MSLLIPMFGASPLRRPHFIPPDMAGCKLWLRGDLGITQAAGLVSAWADQSGNANDAAQGTGAKQPVFSASSINGQPGLTFSGAKFLDGAGDPVGPDAARTYFIVASLSDGGDLYVSRPNGTALYQDVPQSSSLGNRWICDGASNTTIATAPALSPCIYESTYAGALGAVTCTIDGVSYAVSGSLLAGDSLGSGYRVNTRDGSVFSVAGDVCEIIIYDSVLASGDATTVRNYLGARYGISV